MNCTSCGASQHVEATFCVKCGIALKGSENATFRDYSTPDSLSVVRAPSNDGGSGLRYTRTPEGNIIVPIIVGAFLGGVGAGGLMVGPWEFFALAIGGSFVALWFTGHTGKDDWDGSLALLIGLSTTIPLPCGAIGFLVGRELAPKWNMAQQSVAKANIGLPSSADQFRISLPVMPTLPAINQVDDQVSAGSPSLAEQTEKVVPVRAEPQGSLLAERQVNAELTIAAARINNRCTVMIDPDTRLNETVTGPEDQITYFYLFPNYSSMQISPDWLRTNLLPNIKNVMCTNRSVTPLLRLGSTFSFVYTGNDGIEIVRFEIRDVDCSN